MASFTLKDIPDPLLERLRERAESDRRSLIHFVTSEKPWLPACAYEERKYFFQVLDRTEWAGWRVPLWKEAYVRLKRAIRTAQDAVARRLRR